MAVSHQVRKGKSTTTKTEYIVIHGVKEINKRREESFTKWDKALKFFREKEAERVHVNMIKKTTETTTNTEVIA